MLITEIETSERVPVPGTHAMVTRGTHFARAKGFHIEAHGELVTVVWVGPDGTAACVEPTVISLHRVKRAILGGPLPREAKLTPLSAVTLAHQVPDVVSRPNALGLRLHFAARDGYELHLVTMPGAPAMVMVTSGERRMVVPLSGCLGALMAPTAKRAAAEPAVL